MRRIIGAAVAALASVIMFAGAPASAAVSQSSDVGAMAVAVTQEWSGPNATGFGPVSDTGTPTCKAVANPFGVQSVINHGPDQAIYSTNPTCAGAQTVSIPANPNVVQNVGFVATFVMSP